MKQTSIRKRLIAIVVLSQALLATGLLLTGVYYTRWRLLSTLDTTMEARAMSLAALVRYTEDASGNVYFDDSLLPSSIDPAHPDLFAIWTQNSGLLVRSHNWPAGLDIPFGAKTHWRFKWNHVHYRALRVIHVPVLDREEGSAFHPQTLTVFYAAPLNQLQQQVNAAAAWIAAWSVLLLVVMVSLALWGIRRGLSPLEQLAERASMVSSQDWRLHVPEDAQQTAELRPLLESMTGMLARLERSFVQQKEFLGNAAHELKTPLAVVKSTLQSLEQRPRSREEYQQGLAHALEDLQRLEQLLQWMLRLARAEQWAHGALRRDLQEIDVGATCQEAVERVRHLATERQTSVHLTKNSPVLFRADPEDLQLVWSNLLENAVRYSPEGGSVEIKIEQTNGGPARITVEDHGSGIPADELPHIFDRFYRGDPSRNRATGGFGLGLAIAKALVEAYGGNITAESMPAKGTRMSVEFPTT
ncbi:MAG TPA: ATP-binding protein [Terriglobales bacterium]|nr:ATP-binding protein [Terriglobales bacterium]